MKTTADPRHEKRKKIIEDLFRSDFHKQAIGKDSEEILLHKKELDEIIQKAAPEYPVDKINKTDLAILRLAVYELTIKKNIPQKVVLNEAIELAKEYSGENSPGFINGALGKLIEN